MLLNRSKAQNGMPEFDNPSFLQLGAGAALAFGSLLPECFSCNLGLWELALEASELFLGCRRWYRTMDLAGDSAREPEMALEFEPGIAQSNQLVLSSQPWVSSSMADRLTWLNIALPAALVAPASLEEDFGLNGEGFGAGFGTEPGLGSFRRLLLRFEGDEDFAPRVRAILEYRNFGRNLPFSQQLRSEFRSCEIDVTVLRSGTRVPKPLSQLRNALRNGTFGAKSCFFHFAMSFAAAKWVLLYCEVALVCQIHFRSCEISSQRLLQCCGMVGNKMLISQRFPSPCEIS
ncbi:hypothetical protein CK203_111043 [Vitis vinifera]|uniref:Uncharacterized protein n=1 Tax=Vitis vinifera TaxID=29760 RepID=A0A438CQT7_VITVI|nr:hypothetical protein CK203_111043 [Vitis vinifera]